MSLLQKFESNKVNQQQLSSKVDEFASDLNRRLKDLETKFLTGDNGYSELSQRLNSLECGHKKLAEEHATLVNDLEQIHVNISNTLGDLSSKIQTFEKKLVEVKPVQNGLLNEIKIKPLK